MTVIVLLTTGDAARTLGVSSERIRQLVVRGRLRVSAKTAAGVRLFSSEEVERLRAERTRRLAGPVSKRGNQ